MRFDCVSIISVFLVICFESELINSQYVPTNRGYNYDDYLRNSGGQYGFNPGGNTRVIPQGNDNKQYPGFIPPGYYPSGYNPVDPYYDRNKPFDPNSRLTYGYDPIIKLPGVLGSWRPDLQGRERLDAKSLNREVIVSTNYGQVQGFYVYLYDNPIPESGFRPEQVQVERVQSTVSVFLGIPYALPPLKENEGRFKPPRAHPSWQSLHAVDYKPVCPQPAKLVNTANKRAVEMNEDCLYLNIFSPNTQAGRGKLYPVMMYIHGGEFVSGSANSFPGHVMAGFYEVVVVTFNYRLGALGFLSTGDQNSPGNYGLLDQIMALTWVYENIDHFNGDRNSITLFGPDAGAASAGLLMVHPRTYFMVSKVIAQSGSATADWALVQDKWRAMNTSKVFAKHLGCTIESSWKMFHCLKGRGFLELGDVNFKPDIGLVTWGPVIDANITMPVNEWYQGWNQRDWYFLNDTVESLIARGQINRNLAYMSGVTTQEAGYMIYNNASLAPTFDISEKFMEQKIRELVLQYNYTLNPKGVYEAIKFMYTYWPDPQCKTCIRNEYINLLSDFLYVGPHDKITKLLLKQNIPVYLYVQNTTVEALKLPEWCKAYHNIEWYFLIGAPFLDIEMLPLTEKITKHEWTFNDRNMSHFFMKAFTNFAKYGNPTFSEILGMHFDRAVPGQLFYLNINTTFNSSILFNYRQVQSVFWSDYLPTVIGNIIPLYYPPIYDFWWDQTSPIHVAFWGLAVLSMFLLALTVILCMLWISSKRDSEHYFNDEFLTLEKESDLNHGIDNRSHSNSNIYEYRDTPSVMSNKTKQFSIGKTGSTPSLRTQDFSKAASVPSIRSDSMISLKDQQTISTSPRGRRREFRPKTTELKDGIPQTAV